MVTFSCKLHSCKHKHSICEGCSGCGCAPFDLDLLSYGIVTSLELEREGIMQLDKIGGTTLLWTCWLWCLDSVDGGADPPA